MSSGGKGDSQSTSLDPELKSRLIKTFDQGAKLSRTAPLNYTGLTMAAPSAATQSYMNQTNNAANLLGLGMAGNPTDGLPEAKTVNGMTGYAANDLYQDEVARQWEQNPQKVQGLNSLVPNLMTNPNQPQGNVPGMPNVPGFPPGYNYTDIARFYRGKIR